MNVLVKEGILGAILLIVGVFDRLYIDWYWVGRTKAWIIPGTEDLMPCMPQSARGARRVSWWHGAIVSEGLQPYGVDRFTTQTGRWSLSQPR